MSFDPSVRRELKGNPKGVDHHAAAGLLFIREGKRTWRNAADMLDEILQSRGLHAFQHQNDECLGRTCGELRTSPEDGARMDARATDLLRCAPQD